MSKRDLKQKSHYETGFLRCEPPVGFGVFDPGTWNWDPGYKYISIYIYINDRGHIFHVPGSKTPNPPGGPQRKNQFRSATFA